MIWKENPLGRWIDEVIGQCKFKSTVVLLGRLGDHKYNVSILEEAKIEYMPTVAVDEDSPDLEEFYTCVYFIDKGDHSYEEWKSFIQNDLKIFYIRLYVKNKAKDAVWVDDLES